MGGKSIEQYFADWEGVAFGFGYGTGEHHTLSVLKLFFESMPEGKYDYRELEVSLTPAIAWLLINALCRDDKIEYGTSPRFGWLTKSGEALSEFVRNRTVEQLEAATDHGEGYIHCYPDHCNCDSGDCRDHNPFWQRNR